MTPEATNAQVKICGITTLDAIKAAANANFIGFIFYLPSPRNVSPEQAAGLAAHTDIPGVAVTVDPSDELLESIFAAFKPDYIQLHGNETPARVQQIKEKCNAKIIKAFSLSDKEDLRAVRAYEAVADLLLFDAKVDDKLPGGNGVYFDWSMLAGQPFAKPWFLSGGIDSNNVEEALRVSGAKMVDVSSGVESSPGIKDPTLVKALVQKVKQIIV